MPCRLLFFVLPLLLLAACSKDASPVRLDFVGNTNLTSSNRTVNRADTIRTHLFAETGIDGAPLKHLGVTVTYSPDPEPITYPALLSTYNPSNTPTGLKLTMLDLTLARTPAKYFFPVTFGARSTSGTERWEFTVTDTDGHSATRAYRLTVRNTDSAAVYHTYTLLPNITPGWKGRAYLSLYDGLALPRFSVDSLPDNQGLIDLVAVNKGGNISLQAPADTALKLPAAWVTRRTTEIRLTTLDNTGFTSIVTAADLATAFESAHANAYIYDSGPLVAGKVIAFKTQDNKYGLLDLTGLTLTPTPALTCVVRIQK